ncbi:arginase family protein [Luteibacter sp. 329MFSha]|uniref:arginase family protein n=1 Tax=Luteibacter sp. 329MFSha TaxID=1798239 RepID=UPI0008D274FE|nr:arginase family protein [Luteibacter sp. 329MFSha]SEW17895.1 Arginase family protein [Luteibacter sp. 329MFSha]
MRSPIVLDLDDSVGPLPGGSIVSLRAWEEAIRFGCSLRSLRHLVTAIGPVLPREHGTVFLGSGDFHHLTWPLVERVPGDGPLQVVVLDNHPDNMRFPFGVHCGSWVRRVAMLRRVSQVHVVGITSQDIGRAHAWENYLGPLRSGKLTYWSTGVDVSWATRLGLAACFRAFADARSLVDAFVGSQRGQKEPVYLSIDKDAFAPEVAMTNWDQGVMTEADGAAIIGALRDRIVASDVTGEISLYRYRTWWKRRLSAMDGQSEPDAAMLREWQAQQHAFNLRLLSLLK